MHTKDFLAQELRKAGLLDMAVKAASGYYHDFLSPLADPALQLDRDLVEAKAFDLRARHHNGEFDANAEESEAWAAGPDGQDAFNKLIKGE